MPKIPSVMTMCDDEAQCRIDEWSLRLGVGLIDQLFDPFLSFWLSENGSVWRWNNVGLIGPLLAISLMSVSLSENGSVWRWLK